MAIVAEDSHIPVDRDLDRIIRSLERVLANGHILIPVEARDLRKLIAAAKISSTGASASR